MTASDLGQAQTLSDAEGWNQTEKDWKLLLEGPGNMCIVAEKDGKVAGTATALVHAGKIAWIGMVIVDKALRGQGAGRSLMTHLIKRLDRIESIRLDATPAGQPLYESLGFIPEYRIFRMTSASVDTLKDVPAGASPENITPGVAEEIFIMDEGIFGANRSYLLKKMLADYPGKALYLSSGGRPSGYILGREGSRYSFIGPLCADSLETARTLISWSFRSLVNKPITLDVPEAKEAFIHWLESAGFVKQRYFVRMYLAKNPYPGNLKLQYLIGGPEYG
jgi:ribosomal protein S18 acetylase RimI-like enzyme